MYEFWYDYVKQKYGVKKKLCYMDTGSFIFYIKTGDIYLEIARDLEARFGTLKYQLEKPLPKGKKFLKILGLMKDELGVKIMTELPH